MKLSKEVLQKIKQIEIHTRRVLSGSMIGDHRSAQKGTGLDFDQIREYQEGDDIRFIDWNASARANKFLVKQYIEERDRTVMLLVDLSGSTFYGSTQELKSEVIAQVASILALVADCGKDGVGAILFADQVEKVVPPQRGRKHVHMLMEQLLTHKAAGKTSIKSALERLIGQHKQQSVVFIISDFFDTGYEKLLKIAARKHEVIAVRCTDPREESFDLKGFLTVQDPETNEQAELSLDAGGVQKFLKEHHAHTESIFKKCGVDLLDVTTDRPFFGEVIRFFRRRMRY